MNGIEIQVGQDGIALLELSHGKANEMGRAQLDGFEALCERLEGSDEVHTLVSYSRRRSSKGTPIFIAGADVTERIGWSDEEVARHVRRQREVLARLRRAPVFHIAIVHGVALGWGTEYLLTCDYRIATREATFGLPETGLGIVPGAGGTSELWSLIGVAQALRLGMTGESIEAREAMRLGLIQEVVETVDVGLERARVLGRRVATRSPTAVAAFKRALLDAVGRPPAERAEIEAQAYERCLESGEARIGRESFATVREGKRPPWGPRR